MFEKYVCFFFLTKSIHDIFLYKTYYVINFRIFKKIKNSLHLAIRQKQQNKRSTDFTKPKELLVKTFNVEY